MTLTRCSFLGVLAGAACSVLGAVYGVSGDEEREYPHWKSEVKEHEYLSWDQLEAVFSRQYGMVLAPSRRNLTVVLG